MEALIIFQGRTAELLLEEYPELAVTHQARKLGPEMTHLKLGSHGEKDETKNSQIQNFLLLLSVIATDLLAKKSDIKVGQTRQTF